MAPPFCYDHPRPAVTVDLAAFALHKGGLRVLLVRRGKEPFAGRWALPGGFLEVDEPVEVAARRELREETGLDVGPVELVGVFGAPGRDPRGRTISLAHAAAVRGPLPTVSGGDDAAEAAWTDPSGVEELAFDHAEILRQAHDWLFRGVLGGTLGLALLPPEFGTGEVRALHKAFGESGHVATWWIRRLQKAGRIIELPGSPSQFRATGP